MSLVSNITINIPSPDLEQKVINKIPNVLTYAFGLRICPWAPKTYIFLPTEYRVTICTWVFYVAQVTYKISIFKDDWWINFGWNYHFRSKCHSTWISSCLPWQPKTVFLYLCWLEWIDSKVLFLKSGFRSPYLTLFEMMFHSTIMTVQGFY